MKRTIGYGILLATLAIGREPIKVTVNYSNQAQIPQGTLREALEEARILFLTSDIQISWMDCTELDGGDAPPECRHNQPTRFRVTFKNGPVVSAATLGFAYPSIGLGNRAAVLYSQVIEFAERYADRSAVEAVIGAAIAHELGHLFLGTHEHGEGIMLPGWQKSNLREIVQRRLRFSRVQQQNMRTGLESRFVQQALLVYR